jgi:hypothetical protein
MWPRTVEVMLGCWLLVTPLVFRTTASIDQYAAGAVVSGSIIAVASLASFWERLAGSRVVTLLMAVWLAAHGYLSAPRPGPPAAQNEIMVGLLLLLFAVLPNQINDPPRPWREISRSER